jgi:SAM-dependent methyltransferase
MKYLNFGSGIDYKKSDHPNGIEWVNLDNNPSYPVEVLYDFTIFPYPFEDNTFDGVLMSHVFEHIDPNINIKVLEELYRICKPGAEIDIKCPHFSHFSAFGDLTHKKYFSSYVFENFSTKDNYYSSIAKFKVVRKQFDAIKIKDRLWKKIYCFLVNPIINMSPILTDQILSKIFLISEIRWVLKVIKYDN